MRPQPVMPEAEVLRLLRLFREGGLDVIVDGGWGVDALLERQTRPHRDLDIAIPHGQVPALIRLLGPRGFENDHRDDATEFNFVLVHDTLHVDVHSYGFSGDEDEASPGIPYPRASLTGTGRIGDLVVRCIEPWWMIHFHSGYALDADDVADAVALSEKFGIPLHPEQRSARDRIGGGGGAGK